MDPFAILPQEKSRYVEQFNSLKPANGLVSGDQAKGFLLQSQLPPPILGQIWYVSCHLEFIWMICQFKFIYSYRGLADLNADGKLDLAEFSIACKLINLKLRGFEIPQTLPPTLKSSAIGTQYL